MASHGKSLVVMMILSKHIRLHKWLAGKRLLRSDSFRTVHTIRSNSFRAIRTTPIDGIVNYARKLVLAGQERRQTRQWVLMASSQAPVGVQRAPSKVCGVLSLDGSAMIERHRRRCPNLSSAIANAKVVAKARNVGTQDGFGAVSGRGKVAD